MKVEVGERGGDLQAQYSGGLPVYIYTDLPPCTPTNEYVYSVIFSINDTTIRLINFIAQSNPLSGSYPLTEVPIRVGMTNA